MYLPAGTLLYSIEAGGNKRRFYHFDEMGSTIFLTDDAGAVTDAYGITPYGEMISKTGNTDNPFTFLGELGVMQEEGTGLYYMRARFYDSATARFLSPDPVRSLHPQAMNPYQYARGNPLLRSDPTGLQTGVADVGVFFLLVFFGVPEEPASEPFPSVFEDLGRAPVAPDMPREPAASLGPSAPEDVVEFFDLDQHREPAPSAPFDVVEFFDLDQHFAQPTTPPVSRAILTIGDVLPSNLQFGVPAAPLVISGFKIAENESPLPRDRVFFNYNYYDPQPPAAAPPLGPEVFGFEKTFLDGNTSIGLRIPLSEIPVVPPPASSRETPAKPGSGAPPAVGTEVLNPGQKRVIAFPKPYQSR